MMRLRFSFENAVTMSRQHDKQRSRSPWIGLLTLGLWSLSGCHDLSGLTGHQALPSGVEDPSIYHTAEGARALYNATLAAFAYTPQSTNVDGGGGTENNGAFLEFVVTSGLVTDELMAGNVGCSGSVGCSPVDWDTRQFTADYTRGGVYDFLQATRNDASEAIGALTAYDSAASPALRGHLTAIQGYSEIFLADLFCSGIPLSTLDFNGDYTLAAGSTTAQVYQDALNKLTAALPLTSDSVRFLNLARIGRGRAFLALAEYDSAASAVAQVPDNYTYQMPVNWGVQPDAGIPFFGGYGGSVGITESDSEGINGLPYRSSGDPRTAAESPGTTGYGITYYMPIKYGGATPGVFPIALASGMEARLIEAEAALHHQQYSVWLAKINEARQLAAPGETALQDPGSSANDSARVSLLFRERAFDLYLTGHRQGDLRRLIRQYHRSQSAVYPVGMYPVGATSYSPSVTAPVSSAELVNPLFKGCFSRGA